MRKLLGFWVRIFWVTICLMGGRLSMFGETHPMSSPVLAWNAVALDTIRFDNTPPPAAARQLAIMHVAMFDAANSLGGGYESFRVRVGAPADALPAAAMAAAAHFVLRHGWPQFTPRFDAELQAQILALPSGPARAEGLAWGKKVARQMVDERAYDGSHYSIDYRSSGLEGKWRSTPPYFAGALLAQWGQVQPFTLRSPDQFRPPAPLALKSRGWAQELNEVKSVGSTNSAVRTREQTEVAWFWADGVGTQSPPGRWNDVAQQLAVAKELPLLESARLFALLNLALADAGIACWDAKYVYDFWRPITAIREADRDGNADTLEDRDWTPLIVTPPFPEFPSGHATFSAAAATILAAVNGSDRFRFRLRSDGLFGRERKYARFSEAAQEAGMSRIYGGIHFMAANLEGQRCGRQVGDHVARGYLRAKALTLAERR